MVDRNLEDSAYYEYFKIVQNTINRLASNSFLIKAWTITLIGSISILTFSILNTIIFTVLIGIVIVFWILDSYYLKMERLYRELYQDNVDKFNTLDRRIEILLFDMKTEIYKNKVKLVKVIFSKTESLFYISLACGLLLLLILNIIIPWKFSI